jgi:DNA-binding beta-propeller fold protein YncE
MSSAKFLSNFHLSILLAAVVFVASCGGGGSNGNPPPITDPPGADTSGLFLATSFGGMISVMTANSGQLTEIPGTRFAELNGIQAMGTDPGGAFIVTSSSPLTGSTPTAQILNIQSGGALSAGPAFGISGDSEGIAVHNNLIAVTDLAHSTLSLFQLSGSSVSLASTANTDFEPHDVIFDASGRHLYVANYVGGTVSVFSVSSTGNLQLIQSTQQIPFGGLSSLSPKRLKLNPAGTKLAAAGDGAVFVWNVSAADGSLSAPIGRELTLYTNLQDLIFDPSGQMVYLLDTQNDLIYGYAVSDTTLTPVMPIHTAAPATGITTNGKGDRLYALEMLEQVETFTRNTVSGGLNSSEVLPIHLSFLPGQIVRIPKH